MILEGEESDLRFYHEPEWKVTGPDALADVHQAFPFLKESLKEVQGTIKGKNPAQVPGEKDLPTMCMATKDEIDSQVCGFFKDLRRVG